MVSGTDTVIDKPIPTAHLLDRVLDWIELRKKFVVAENNIVPVAARGSDLQRYRGVQYVVRRGERRENSFAALGCIFDPTDIPLMKPLFQATQACFNGVITSVGQVTAIVQQTGIR